MPLAVEALLGIELMKSPISVPKERLVPLSIIMLPVGMMAQAYVSKSFAGGTSKPLHVFLKAYQFRLVLGAVIPMFILFLRQVSTTSGDAIPSHMYAVGMFLMCMSSAVSSTMFVAQMGFFNRVSDPRIGGTYMTMLNTISNLGGQWPGTVLLTLKSSIEKTPGLDSFSIVCCASVTFGLAWLGLLRGTVRELQERPLKEWHAVQ